MQPPSRDKAGDDYAREHEIDFAIRNLTCSGIKWTYHVYFLPEANQNAAAATSSSNAANLNSPPGKTQLPPSLLGTIGDLARRPSSSNVISVADEIQEINPKLAPSLGTNFEYFLKMHTVWRPMDSTIDPKGRPEQKHPFLKGKYRFDATAVKWKNVTSYYQAARKDTKGESVPGKSVVGPVKREMTVHEVGDCACGTASKELLAKFGTMSQGFEALRRTVVQQDAKIDRLFAKVDLIEHLTRDTRRRQFDDLGAQERHREVIALDESDDEEPRRLPPRPSMVIPSFQLTTPAFQQGDPSSPSEVISPSLTDDDEPAAYSKISYRRPTPYEAPRTRAKGKQREGEDADDLHYTPPRSNKPANARR